jgi:predicted component of type VI protein secretion system
MLREPSSTACPGIRCPTIVELATQGLEELERFRAENSAAARSIEAALAEYERRLREASEHPETHLLECEHRYPGSALR